MRDWADDVRELASIIDELMKEKHKLLAEVKRLRAALPAPELLERAAVALLNPGEYMSGNWSAEGYALREAARCIREAYSETST